MSKIRNHLLKHGFVYLGITCGFVLSSLKVPFLYGAVICLIAIFITDFISKILISKEVE